MLVGRWTPLLMLALAAMSRRDKSCKKGVRGNVPTGSSLNQELARKWVDSTSTDIDTTTEKELAEGRRIRRPRCLVFEIGGERAVPAAVRLLLAFQQILILGNQESKRAVAC